MDRETVFRYDVLEKQLKQGKYLLVFDGMERFLREGDTPNLGIPNSPGVRRFFDVISSPKSKSVVLLTTRLWPLAFNKPAGESSAGSAEILDTVADVPIRPITSSDFKEEEPFLGLQGVSDLCFLLDGHIYALALAMGVLGRVRRDGGERQGCLAQLNNALRAGEAKDKVLGDD